MRRARRIAIVFSAILLVGIVAVVLRTLDAMGLFAEVAPVACRTPSWIVGVTGAGAMQYDAPSNTLFVASTNGRRWPEHAAPDDGIYVYRPGSDASPVKLTGASADFHPTALSVYRAADGSLTLMTVIQPVNGKPAVDIFDVSGTATGEIALHERETITGNLLFSPNDIVAVDKGRFYATNDHTSRTGLGQVLEIHLMLPRANVVYFDGADFRVVADGLRLASGIGLSPDGNRLYVAESSGRQIRTYSRNPLSGDLAPLAEMPIPSDLESIDVQKNGDLFVAAEPKLIDAFRFRFNPAKPSPSQVFKVPVDRQGIPRASELVYAGTDIGGASSALPQDGRLLIGSSLVTKILSCALGK